MEQKLTVLGINSGHDAGAAIVRDGKILAAINEERIKNIKHYNGIPTESIKEVIRISNIDPAQIEVLSIVGINYIDQFATPYQIPSYLSLFFDYNSITLNRESSTCFVSYAYRFRNLKEIKKILSELGISTTNIIFVEHHFAHAATAYYLSPWSLDEEVLILTADAAGDGLSSTVSIGYKGQIERIKNSETTYFDSVGYCFYGPITQYLGMKFNYDEYKVMGLAPYGKPEFCLDKMKNVIDIDQQNPLKFKNKIGSFYPYLQESLHSLLMGQRFDNIGAATQVWFEKIITRWVLNAIKETKIHKIACAGGDFLNVKANKLILEMNEVDDVFFCPAAGDEGIAVGAALVGYFEFSILNGKKPNKVPLENVYLGTEFSNEYIKNCLKENDLLNKAEFFDDIDAQVGEIISKEMTVVARFNGRMEWGPRGLGNRSIVANPANSKIITKINHAIKMRDFWMPFAPSILTSRIRDYLINPRNAPYMILAFDTTDQRNDLAAAVHPYDFTCRPQTVDSTQNLGYQKLIKSFEAKTGIGGVLNTSFNLHGFPIVFDPKIAISTFKNSQLDFLAIGNYLVKK